MRDSAEVLKTLSAYFAGDPRAMHDCPGSFHLLPDSDKCINAVLRQVRPDQIYVRRTRCIQDTILLSTLGQLKRDQSILPAQVKR